MSATSSFSTNLLLGLPRETIRDILEYLPAAPLLKMWITGDRRLQSCMVNGGVRIFRDQIPVSDVHCSSVPRALGCFVGLKKLDVPLSFKMESLQKKEKSLHLLPESLEELRLVIWGLHAFLKRQVDHHSGETMLFSFTKLFPRLHSLVLISRELRSQIKETLTLDLPPTLTALELSSSFLGYNADFAAAHPNLTSLTLEYVTDAQAKDFTLPPNLEMLKLISCPSAAMVALIPALLSLTTLELWLSFDFFAKLANQSELSSVFSRLPKNLTSLYLTNATLDADFLPSLPRSLTSLNVQKHGNQWISEDLIQYLPKTMRFLRLTIVDPSYPNSFVASRNGDLLSSTEPEPLIRFLEGLPRSLKILNWCFRGVLNSDALLVALPPDLTSFSVPIELAMVSASVIPQKLSSVTPHATTTTTEELAKLPRDLRHIQVSRWQLTTEAGEILRSFTKLKMLRKLPIEPFAKDIPGHYVQIRKATPDKPEIIIPQSLVDLSTFVPSSVTLLKLLKTEDKIFTLDFGSLADPSSSCRLTTIMFSQPIYRLSDLEAATIRYFIWEPSNVIPSLVRLHFQYDSLTQHSLQKLYKIVPNLLELSISRLNYALTDIDLKKLPPKLRTAHFYGDATEVTAAGVLNMPRGIRSLNFPTSPHASWEKAKLSIVEVRTRLPPHITKLHFSEDSDMDKLWARALDYNAETSTSEPTNPSQMTE